MICEAFNWSLIAAASAPSTASLVARSCCCSGEKRGCGVGDHQHLIQPVKMRGRFHDHVDKAVAVGIAHHFLHHAHRQSPRKDQVAARSQNLFAGLDALVGQNAAPLRVGRPRFRSECRECVWSPESRPRRWSGSLIDQHLRGVGKHVAHLAHDAVGGNHRHIRLQAVV